MRIPSLVLALSAILLPVADSLGKNPSPATELLEASMTIDVPPEAYVWNWRDAVLMKSYFDIARSHPDRKQSVDMYAKAVVDRLASKASGLHPNAVASGVALSYLRGEGLSDQECDMAFERVWKQYLEIPRTPQGGCSHRPNSVELWDDTLYMCAIFLLESWRSEGDFRFVSELCDQVLCHAEKLMDPQTGLWYHVWTLTDDPVKDYCCQSGFNQNPLHRNTEFWGRGNGWVAMCLVDLLEVLPESDARYSGVLGLFNSMMMTLYGLQDRRSGMWYQLPVYPGEEGNFEESSATAMFAYAMAKGARLGLLPCRYLCASRKAFRALTRDCLENVGTPEITLGRICQGTCAGDKAYYYARKTVSAETYALGAYLMLANELKEIK